MRVARQGIKAQTEIIYELSPNVQSNSTLVAGCVLRETSNPEPGGPDAGWPLSLVKWMKLFRQGIPKLVPQKEEVQIDGDSQGWVELGKMHENDDQHTR